MDPSKLRRKADHLEAQADALFAQGDHEAALKLYTQAALYREAAERLCTTTATGKVNKKMTREEVQARNVAISAAKATDKLSRAIREKLGLSLRAYAPLVGVSASSLNNYRLGRQRVPRRVYDRVKADTGFTAWPLPPLD